MTVLSSTSTHKATSHLLGSYIAGFILSIGFTIVAYVLVVHHNSLNRGLVISAITGLAATQFVAQLVFFLHVGAEQKARWKTIVLITMIVVVGILVIGSLWIMSNLNQHMSSEQINTYMRNQDGL